jgi:hypothetical protein
MEKSGKISARRHANTWKRLFDRASATDSIPAFEHQDASVRPREIRGAGKTVVTGADNDNVPAARGELADRSGQSDLA